MSLVFLSHLIIFFSTSSQAHFLFCLCFVILIFSSVFVVENFQWSSLELQTNQSQDTKWSSKSSFMTLITSCFPYLCFLVYLCIYMCVFEFACVYRVLPHLESELCFPLGPFPCYVKSFLLPVSLGSPPPPLSCCFL